jgi:Uma2 family endonuclease
VKAVLHLPRRATYVDYLAVEQASDRRHEYFDGVIVAMAGGSPEHNALTARFVQLLGANLPRGCRAFTPDQRYWIAATRRGRYSDASVICGRVEHPTHDDQAAENPRIVIEVLSPTTAGDDEGEKRRDFQSLATLEVYVLAAQDSHTVKVHRRDDNGTWPDLPETYAPGQEFALPGLARPLTVAELYDDILDASGASLLR